jgi:hypothetical protein
MNARNARKRAAEDEITATAAPPTHRRRTVLGTLSNNVMVLQSAQQTYHRLEQETADATALRRNQQAAAKEQRRRNRTRQRGDIITPSPIPPTPHRRAPVVMNHPPQIELLSQPSLSSRSIRAFFRCSICRANRSKDLLMNGNLPEDPVCSYCLLLLDGDEEELKFCTNCRSEKARRNFFPATGQETDLCSDCLLRLSRRFQSSQRSHSPSPVGLRHPAVSNTDWNLVTKFNQSLDELEMAECTRCEERWFNMGVVDGICRACQLRKSNPFEAANEGDLGPVPDWLPVLSEVEEMLIARAHVHVQVKQVQGQQLKYTGHTVNFMQNTQKIYYKLPLLPTELDIVLLKPASGMMRDERAINSRFEGVLKVRRRNVEIWLNFLKENHPDYRYIDIDSDHLAALPEDGSIQDQLPVQYEATEDPGPNQGPTDAATMDAETDPDIDLDPVDTTAMIPGLTPNITEFERLQHDLIGDQPDPLLLPDRPAHPVPPIQLPPPIQLSVASFRQTPISEYDKKCLIRMVFPTLFPLPLLYS